MSLWVEALCIHEWCLFTERVDDSPSHERGRVYRLLTERPGNRLPLDWERNEINLLMLEGANFVCPWTERPLQVHEYQIDHIVPVTVYPFNELWNLIPSDSRFNMHTKRARIPSPATMTRAAPRLAGAYRNYQLSSPLATALGQDVAARFASPDRPEEVVGAVRQLVEQITEARNLPSF